MPSMFAVPLPENLDEELALEDQRLQRKRGRMLAAAGGSGGSISGGTNGTEQGKSTTSSFAARDHINGVTPTGGGGANGSMTSSTGGEGSPLGAEEEEDVFNSILLLTTTPFIPPSSIAPSTNNAPSPSTSVNTNLLRTSSSSTLLTSSGKQKNISAADLAQTTPPVSNASISSDVMMSPQSPTRGLGSSQSFSGAGFSSPASSPKTTADPSPSSPAASTTCGSAFEQMLNAKPGLVPGMGRVRMREVCAFCNFLYPGKKQSFSIRVSDQAKGADVVDAAIKAFLAADERLRGKMSDNPRDYKLHIADDQTGDCEFQVSLDGQPGKCSTVALEAMPVAYLNKFPQHAQLLPMCNDDIPMVIMVKGAKNSRTVLLAPDLTMDRVEDVLAEKMRLKDLVKGSLTAMFGPTAVGLNQSYGFGAGGEKVDAPPLRMRTILSLHRFGVKELGIAACLVDDCPPTHSAINGDDQSDSLIHFRKIDEEEASTYRQFEVIKTNKFGAKQERILGVDRDRIYNTKLGNQLGKTKNPERNIADIHSLKTYPERPCYFEINYSGASQDTDRIECKTKLDCAVLVETLRVLKKIAERRKESEGKKEKGFLSKLFGGKSTAAQQ